MTTGTSYDNANIQVGDQISCMGGVVSITGSAPSKATVVVAEISDGNQFTCQAQDVTCVQHALTPGAGVGMSMNGKYLDAGDRVTVNGLVHAISGSGLTAQLTVVWDHSGLTSTVSAGSCHSNAA